MSARTQSIDDAPPAWRHGEPYRDQDELIADRFGAIRSRARAAAAHAAALAEDERSVQRWPAALVDAEAAIEARLLATRCELPIQRVRTHFGLSRSEELVLWTLIAHELCPIARQLVRNLATEQVSDPSTDALRRLVYGASLGAAAWRELAEDGALRRFGLIAPTDDPASPEYRQTWKVGPRILRLVHGDLGLDGEVAELARPDAGLPPVLETLELAGDAAARIAHGFERAALIVVHGRIGHGRRSVLLAIAAQRGLSVLAIDARALAKERDTARRQLRAIARECRLLDRVPLLCDLDTLAASGDAPDRLDLVESELEGLTLATATRAIARRWSRPPLAVELGPISGAQRTLLWQRALPMAGPGDCELLATMYPLAPSLIEAAGRLAIDHSGGGEMRPAHIESGLRAVLDDRLAGLATRLTVSQTWDDLVLPDDQTLALVDLLARIRERRRVYEDWGFAAKVGKGLGIAALFSGPPGTGKSMAAGLVARSLHTELYQVDLSKIVSKWIGETEKNLAALFDAAEAGHAILLFDEADALFGKRTDVRSSNDRHANQEVNYLLQRLESFAGVIILTSNHESAIDEAFRRRLSVHVRFPMPDVEERRHLWRAMIPERAPVAGDLGLDALATTYVMSGGYIRNAVLRAAFLAADEQGAIDAARLARAAQLEYEAMGKVVASR